MDTVSVSGLPELQAHLEQAAEDASIPLDAKLLDTVELQLTETNIPSLLPLLLPTLTRILKSTSQDPTPLLSFTIKLLASLSFTQALAVADAPSLLAALRSPLPGAQLLALAILNKAAASPSDASILSSLPELVHELVRCWLATRDVGSGQRATRVLGNLLGTDCDLVPAVTNGVSASTTDVVRRRLPGHGRLWRLILMDHHCLSLIQSLCSPSNSDHDSPRPIQAVTLSQGRLLGLLPRLAALNMRPLTQCAFADLFPLDQGTSQLVGRGLLQWATLNMVDKSDLLMRLNLIGFIETFVSIMRVSQRTNQRDQVVKKIVLAAIRDDPDVKSGLETLPDRTVEEESEPLRSYIAELMAEQ
ncbi:hypothetical protein CDD81_5511 [Ophiocordyceps australis]|uniref:DNA mismatch repair protein HSM3 N-terminal domain-containing protein n=1 Tax=Ophiocordyceps australis TaxID=1399860 RepID=A0A2C5Y7R4_9HYPO|nr:hypothetical protein CDD81_5511 [Ophiocordyceps australis]